MKPRKRKRTERLIEPDKPAPRSTDKELPILSFQHVDSRTFRLSAWHDRELDDLIRCFQKIERHTWEEIKRTGGSVPKKVGLGYTIRDKSEIPPLPTSVPDDATIFELRVCSKKRIFAHRADRICYIIWFDREHSI